MRISDWSSDVCSSDLDLLHRHAARIAFNRFFRALLVGINDALDVLVAQLVLPLSLREVLRAASVDEQHIVRLLALLEHQDADRDAGGIEQVGRQANHGVYVAVLEQLGADVRFLAAAEQHTVRSEEHTSELQSLMRISYAVFCLKKKTT